ncbi:MAG: GNAT family N-acetyltransferase [Proteobacteria bacterium]|nr:GNAT family N-acetyltransferase [Pseudomonadota bacterium]
MARGGNSRQTRKNPPGTFGGARDGLQIYWNGATVRQWDAWIEAIPRSSIEQTWAYGEAFVGVTPYMPAHGVVYRGANPVAIVQVVEWRVGGTVRIAKIVRGPLFFEDISESEKISALGLIRDRYALARLDLLLWTPEIEESPEAEGLFRRMSLRRVVTGYSSVWLDLRRDEADLRRDLHQKWRNQLVRAEAENLRVRLGHSGASLEWLLTRHEGHRRRRRLRAPAAPFVLAISLSERNKQSTLAFTAHAGSEPISAILLFRHGRTATYYIAWTGPEGRRRNAHNLLLWQAVKELKSRGVHWLDLGGVDGLSMPGVSRFKVGMGGRLFTLAGTFM